MWVWCVPRVVWGLFGVLSSMSQYSKVLVTWCVLVIKRVKDAFKVIWHVFGGGIWWYCVGLR